MAQQNKINKGNCILYFIFMNKCPGPTIVKHKAQFQTACSIILQQFHVNIQHF